MTDSTARQPKGIPAGGQFAPTSHTEPQVALGLPFGAFTMDPDGTEWDRADNEDWPWAEPGTAMIESGQVNGVGILIEAGADGSAEDRVRYHVVDYRGMSKVRTGEADTLEEAKEAAKEERYQLALYAQGHWPLEPGARTPWGEAQHTARVAIGMDVCSTAGHGGWKVPEERKRAIDPAWRDTTRFFEQDCAWAAPAITHWRDLPAEQVAEAHRLARRWMPASMTGSLAGTRPSAASPTTPLRRRRTEMSTEAVNRQPKGIPAGGQYAPTLHTEPEIVLAQPASDLLDADGTRWEHDGDEHAGWSTTSQDGYELRVVTDIRDEAVRWSLRGNGPSKPGSLPQGSADSLEDAKAEAQAARARIAGYGHNRMHVGGPGLRGRITAVTEVSPGIDSVLTEHHGFYVLTEERNLEVDPAWRRDRWYEGDSAWAIPVITHHRDLDWALVKRAHEEARRYFLEQYEAVVGKDPDKYGIAHPDRPPHTPRA